MLLSFGIENWMSFREEAVLSMAATRERQHNNRIARHRRMRILPATVIYGANASGKSNFVQALEFAQKLVVDGAPRSGFNQLRRFLLSESTSHPDALTNFRFELLLNGQLYEYYFAINSTAVVHEELIHHMTRRSRPIFKRHLGEFDFFRQKQTDKALNFLSKHIKPNQLLVHSAAEFNNLGLEFLYDWFDKQLKVIHTTSEFQGLGELIAADSEYSSLLSDLISNLDTGVTELQVKETPLENHPIAPFANDQLMPDEGGTTTLFQGSIPFTLSHTDSGTVVREVEALHKSESNETVPFSLRDESEGTIRLLHLGPAFLILTQIKQPYTFVIDELDRSLHTLATRSLLEYFLSTCTPDGNKQLIFTTHDVALMDQNLFRRDEMWLTTKNNAGESQLYALSEFKGLRDDKDVRRSYMQGRFGGIPRIPSSDILMMPSNKHHGEESK